MQKKWYNKRVVIVVGSVSDAQLRSTPDNEDADTSEALGIAWSLKKTPLSTQRRNIFHLDNLNRTEISSWERKEITKTVIS